MRYPFDVPTINRVLDKLGVDRVERGLLAFDHEPTGSWCNCFATECFRPELQVKEDHMVFIKSGKWFDSYSIAGLILLPQSVCSKVFECWYERYPEQLVGVVVDWLVKQEKRDG